MKPFLMLALLSFLVTGMATAQPPVDYVLLCGDEPIGVVSVVDGELHAAVIAGETCAVGDLAILGYAGFEVTVWVDAFGAVMVSVEFGDDADSEMSAAAVVVPQEAIRGMLTAQGNRAAAMERAALAREGRPELPETAVDDLVEATDAGTEFTPTLPEVAADEAVEATERRGEDRAELPDAITDERGEDRPELPEAARDRRP